MIYRNFIYDQKQSSVFAYIPNVACTNWKSVMRRLAGQPNWLKARVAHDPEASGLTLLSADDPLLGDLLAQEETLLLTMVRNPFTRVLSAYLDKIARRIDAQKTAERRPDRVFDDMVASIDAYRREMGSAAPEQISFEVFLRWVEAGQSPDCANEHWAPQSTLIGRWTDRFHGIGRFEAMDRDAPLILQSMGAAFPFPTQTDVRFPATDAADRIEQFFTDDAVERVRRIYAADFAAFGYPTTLDAARDVLPAMMPFPPS